MKKVLITCGGTIEPIDKVRGITNFSSGRLGVRIAKAFIEEKGDEVEVLVIHGKKVDVSGLPEEVNSTPITSVNDLRDLLQGLKNKDKYVPDLVIHSMAVSDYTVGLVTSLKYIDDNYVEDIVYEVKGSRTIPDKMSSELEYPVIILKRTPKVIDDIKSLWPETYLVGFKLLNNSTPLQLLTAQVNLMERAKCDMVVGNDLSTISAEGHLFKVLTDKGEILPFNTKASLAYFLTKVI